MDCCANITKRRSRAVWIGVIGIFGAWAISGRAARGTEAQVNSTAERLVDEARQAELAGDTPRYFSLLRQAVRSAPNYELARWHLGQMQVDGEWLAVEEAQHRAAVNPRQAEYRDLRKAQGESLGAQLALARWCRKNNLDDEAKFHWASVLSVAPNNEEALRAVDMRWHNGRLLTHGDIARQKEQQREFKRAAKRWAPTLGKWRRAVSENDSEKRDAALAEISTVTDIDVIPAVENITLGRDATNKRHADGCRQISLAFMDALEKMHDQAAIESLVRHAVNSPFADTTSSAIRKLHDVPRHNYIPLLLSGLAMPIESSFSINTAGDGSVHYVHSLYREGPDTDWSFDARLAIVQQDFNRFTWDASTGRLEERDANDDAAIAIQKERVARQYQSQYGNTAAATERQVWNANQTTLAVNRRILPVLEGVTGQRFGDSPKAWWNWWYEQNEYYAADDHPVEQHYFTDTDTVYYPPEPPPTVGGHSCFPKGTLVWTKTGQRPIESLELGDLVLAQNIDTGELAYKPVIRRTVRPPTPILTLSIGGEELQATGSHPLWVAGAGWQMAKELGDGAILHSLTGAAQLESIQPAGQAEAYNLAVADYNTYFVGESGVLVHDVTQRRPTLSTTPGLTVK
jgi:hypothetical protein